jgi:hypothetical protein
VAVVADWLQFEIDLGAKAKHRQTLHDIIGQFCRQSQDETRVLDRYVEQANDASLRVTPARPSRFTSVEFLHINRELTLQKLERISAAYH